MTCICGWPIIWVNGILRDRGGCTNSRDGCRFNQRGGPWYFRWRWQR